jgi:tetratricopeptide (TPR) repeat protein
MAEPVALKYRAFISYSHADTNWAKWLHRALEGFTIDKDLVGRETATGAIPKALRPVFRDRDDFTAGHTLSDQTLAALDASHALIVICSSESAKSRYVNEEVRLFKSRHPERPVIPLIVGGKPGDAEQECFAPALKFKLDADGQITDEPVELLAADAREEGDGKSLALAKVVAGQLGVSSDDIFRRAQRERRRRQQRWIAGLSVVALMLAGLAVWAEINRREAVAQRQEAERNFEVAKQGANSLVFDIAQALRDQQGMRTETVRRILGTAEQVIDKLVAKSNGNPGLLNIQVGMLDEIAKTYAVQGDTAKWDEAAQKGLAIVERLAHADPADAQWQRNLFLSYHRIGDVRLAEGNLAEALKFYRDGLAIVDRLVKSDPSTALWQSDLALCYQDVGDVLQAQGDLAGALKSYRDGLAIRERLAKAEPSSASLQSELSFSYDRIGDVLEAQGDLAGALKSYRDGLAVIERLTETDPGNAGWRRDLSVIHNEVGRMLQAQGKLDEALQSYKDGLTIIDALARSDSNNAFWQRDLAISYNKLGDVLQAQGDLAGALKSYRDSLTIWERLAKADPAAVPSGCRWRQ